jgi:hypothetical protein
MISEPVVRSAETVHLSCTDTNTLETERNEIPHDPRQLGVPSHATKMIFQPMVRLEQNVHLSCDKISIISKQTKTSFHLSLVI